MLLLEMIKSKENKLLKHAKKLNTRKYRQENNEFMIEGIRFVEEAIDVVCAGDVGVFIKYCLCSESLNGDRIQKIIEKMQSNDIKLYKVQDGLIEEICETKSPQGILAIVEKKEIKFSDIIKKSSFAVIVDRIQDPGNLGAIIRSADAAGADLVIVNEGTVDVYSPKVLRATMGSIFHVPVIFVDDVTAAIEDMKIQGFKVYASSLEGSTIYYEENYCFKSAIVIGNEANGIDNKILQCADRLIKIPMPGKSESLNASVACGILLFEVVKQRMNIDK